VFQWKKGVLHLSVMYVFHFVLILDLRSAVLRDFAFQFLFSLGDFSVPG
jgi:hypothetical protein